MVTGYPDYQALNELLAAIGSPAQSGGKTLLDVVNELTAVISQVATGSPPITSPVLLANAGFLPSIGAGAVATFGPYATTGSSYSISFQPGKNGRGTTPFMAIFIVITDSSGATVDAIEWAVPQSSIAEDTNYIFEGPIASGNIMVTIENFDSTASAYNFTLTATTLPLSKHFGQAINFASVPGFTIPSNLSVQELILDLTTASIAAGGTLVHLLPPSSGQLALSFRGHNTAGNMLYQLFPLTDGNSFAGTGGAPIWAGSSTTAAEVAAVVPAPRCATVLKVSNNALTTANTNDVAVVAIPA